MIDPLRPYWPTNRSLAGLIVRVACLAVAAAGTFLAGSRALLLALVGVAALGQAALVVFEWMEFRRTKKSGLAVAGVSTFLFLGLVFVLFVEARSVVVLTQR